MTRRTALKNSPECKFCTTSQAVDKIKLSVALHCFFVRSSICSKMNMALSINARALWKKVFSLPDPSCEVRNVSSCLRAGSAISMVWRKSILQTERQLCSDSAIELQRKLLYIRLTMKTLTKGEHSVRSWQDNPVSAADIGSSRPSPSSV